MDYKTLLALSLKNSDNLFLILSDNMVIMEISPVALKILGCSKKEVCNKSIDNLFKKYSIQPFIEINKPVKKAKTSTYVLNNSRELKINWNIIPLYGQDKKIDLVFVIGRLATELTDKQIEYLQLENVVKYAPGFFYWKNKNGVYQGCNDEFANLAGLDSRTQVIGKTDFDLIWKERAQLYVDIDKEVIKTGKANLNHEEKIIVSNNRIITAITNKVPLFDNHNKVVGILGITTDITQQKMTEEALSLAKIDAESANILKTNFIQNMQHDIRTPAASVWAVLDNLVENRQLLDEELLIMLRNSAKQLWGICNDVIDFDRIEHGDMPVFSKRFDIRQLVNNVIELNQITAFDKNLILSCTVDKKIPQILKGDEHRLSRILINLMGNALKFTQNGSILLVVSLIEEHSKNYIIQFKLQDTGIGIPPEKQDTIFEKFIRLNPANRNTYKGSGLGLRIVKKYVDDLGGEINLQSEMNKGTIFYIDIPFEKALVATVYNHSLSFSEIPVVEKSKIHIKKDVDIKPSMLDTKKEKKLDVLLIEDNPLAKKIGETLLKSINCNVTTATDVGGAIEMLQRVKFDLVVADIGLPDGTGIDVIIDAQKNNSSLNFKTPFFALTANADSCTIEESKQAGFLQVMEKPMRIKIIQPLISQFVLNKNQISSDNIEESRCSFGPDLPATEKELLELEQYPLLDVANAVVILGDESTLYEMLKDMVIAIPKDRAEFEQTYAAHDWQRIEELTHRVKSGASYCGIMRIKYACQYLERYHKAGYSELLEKLYQQLIKVLGDTQQCLESWLKEKKQDVESAHLTASSR